MKTIEEINKWSYKEAWQFFNENAINRYVPELKLYFQSLEKNCKTIDLRDDKDARKKILESVKGKKTLILVDGSSLNGKTTFANRLSNCIDCEIVDIDILCIQWIEKHLNKVQVPFERNLFISKIDRLTDEFILDNLEKIIQEKSTKTVILVGCYIELLYRAIISKTLGKYFDQVVSIYFCAKTYKEIKMLFKKREEEFKNFKMNIDVFEQYQYSKKLLEYNGYPLGVGMDVSFIADIHVSDMFV